MIESKISYFSNGNKHIESYYLDNYLHNINGPAVIVYYKNGNKHYEAYYLNGKRHNLNNHAYIAYYEDGNKNYEEYWFNNIYFCNKQEMNKYILLNNLS